MTHKWRASLFTLLLVGALGLVFLTTSSVYADPPAGTISYWKLDEDTTPPIPPNPGVTYVDSITATGNDGQDNGNPPTPEPGLVPTPTLAVPNTAQLFDGAATGINVPADPSFDWAVDGSFSIEFWIRPVSPGTGHQVIISRSAGSQADSLRWWVKIDETTSIVEFLLIPEDGLDGGGGPSNDAADFTVVADINAKVLAADQWYHIVAVRDNDNDKNLVYIDGVKEGELNIDYTKGFSSATTDLLIGEFTSFNFDGTIDEVALYNRALDATEIAEHITANLNGDGIDTLVTPPSIPPSSGGGGGSSGCFIATSAR